MKLLSREQGLSIKIFELQDLMIRIQNVDKAIPKINDKILNEDLQFHLNEDIKRFKALVEDLKLDLDSYYKFEVENSIPVNLAYRRLYNELGYLKV